MAEWRTKTCGTCVFFDPSICQRYPPTLHVEPGPISESVRAYYIPVSSVTPACGEWREGGRGDG